MKTNCVLHRLAFLTLCFSGLPLSSIAGVYDDVAAWWHFDYDANSDGLAQAGEIRDQRDWGTVSTPGGSGHHASVTHGLLGSPAWTNAAVSPAGGDLYGRMSMYFNPTNNGEGACYPDTFQVDNFLLSGSATIVTRFRWDGLVSDEPNAWIYNNGLGWNEQIGWMFGIRGDNGTHLGLWIGQTPFYFWGDTIITGKWYEAAAVLTDNGDNDTVEFFLWPEGGTLEYQKQDTSAILGPASANTGTIIGAEAAASGFEGGNAFKTFKGAVNHIAVWNRALSYSEVVEAFGKPQPLFEIGLNNNSGNDLGLESEVGQYYTAGDPWCKMRRAVTAETKDATIQIPLSSIQASLNCVFHVKTLTYGQGAGLSLIVNSTTNETKSATAGKDLYWYIPASQLITGSNSFTLHYTGGDAVYVVFDWLEIGGAWQVGYDDYSQGEFSNEGEKPDDFYVGDPNWLNLERAAVLGSDSNIVVHFSLSSELASKFTYTYTTRVIQQGGPNQVNQFPFSISINGQQNISYPAKADNTLITIPIDRTVIKGGDNTINLMYNGPLTWEGGGGWMQFDFHRLTVKEYPKGTAIIVR